VQHLILVVALITFQFEKFKVQAADSVQPAPKESHINDDTSPQQV